MRHLLPLLSCFAFLLGPYLASAAEPKYSAAFADGSRITAGTLTDWFEPQKEPKLNGRPLLDANSPALWLEQDDVEADAPPRAYVEMIGGDRLPGMVVGYADEAPPGQEVSPHVFVEPSGSFDWQEGPPRKQLRVLSGWLQKIVLDRRKSDTYHPGTLFFRDGRQVAFQSIRFAPLSVHLLLEGGRQEVMLIDIAELHMPKLDPWESYYQQLALLSPDCSAMLVRMETLGGLRATTSTERLRAVNYGGHQPDRWYHAIQPAWALDPLWVKHIDVQRRQFFRPQEPPLSLVSPDKIEQRSALGDWPPRRDRNVLDQPLHAAGEAFGWGYGVQAYTRLEYQLPTIAESFRTRIALDTIAGDGGCAKASVYLGDTKGTPLFASKVLIGSQEVIDTGPLNLQGKEPRRLILVADPVAKDAPEGADPLDIRDTLDWLQPQVKLNQEQLRELVAQRVLDVMPSWESWQASVSSPADIAVVTRWDEIDRMDRRFRMEVRPQQKFLTLKRTVRVGPQDSWLLLYVSRSREDHLGGRSTVQVRLDGVARAEMEIPERSDQGNHRPIAVPVTAYRGRSVPVEVVLVADNDHSWSQWESYAVVERIPDLLPIITDSLPAIVAVDGEAAEAKLTEDAFSGTSAAQVAAGETARVELPQMRVPIRQRPELGEYRYIRYAWKKRGGQQIALGVHYEPPSGGRFVVGDERLLEYHAGQALPMTDGVKRQRIHDRVPEEWVVVTRDLFGEMGAGELTGLSLTCPDGEIALFDHIYLARSMEDFQYTEKPRTDPKMAEAATESGVLETAVDPVSFGRLLGSFAPQFSTLAVGQGGMQLLKEHAGRQHVLRTHPVEHGKPCVLRAYVEVPPMKKPRLSLEVSHRMPDNDWQLVVKGNGEVLVTQKVAKDTVTDGWLKVDVDLAKFAGQQLVLEVLNQADNWAGEDAIWGMIQLVD